MAFTCILKLPQGQEQVFVYRDILPEEIPDDDAYVDITAKVAPYTMTGNGGAETTYELFQAVKYLAQNRIPGDMVECGVWRGGSMMLIALALKYFNDAGRSLYLYDTYAGMTEPTAVDIDVEGNDMRSAWIRARQHGGRMAFGGTLEDVRANMRQTGYADAQVRYVEGDVLRTIPRHLPSRIALLRLDTDWYESTLHELRHMYDLIVPNGVLIIDDYGWCRGARKATDEFFRDHPFKPLMHRVNDSVRVIVKPAL